MLAVVGVVYAAKVGMPDPTQGRPEVAVRK
jgi:hypothetical protein